MANSNSIQNSLASEIRSVKSSEPLQFQPKKHKIKLNPKLRVAKVIKECESEVQEESVLHGKKLAEASHSIKEHDNETARIKENYNKSFKKSKSNKNIKPKSKSGDLMTNIKKITPTKQTMPLINMVTSLTDRSHKLIKNIKSPPKMQQKNIMGSTRLEPTKLLFSEKKAMGGSENIKITRIQSPLSSVRDNLHSIKFNKVKSPPRFDKSPAFDSKKTRIPHQIFVSSLNDKFSQSRPKNKSVNTGTSIRKPGNKCKTLSGAR
jgi:hypothetical protein